MDNKLTIPAAIELLRDKVKNADLPQDLVEKLNDIFTQLEINANSENTFWNYYQSDAKYFDWVTSLPWNKRSQDILDVRFAKEELDKHHYGLQEVKNPLYVSRTPGSALTLHTR